MDRLVYYHHPQAENLSLTYSSDDRSEVLTQRDELDDDTEVIRYPFEVPVYVLYEGNLDIDAASDIDFDRGWLSDRISELP